MLESLQIKGFKSLEDVDLAFPRLLVVFGPNAAGKSNLLDALQVFSRLGTERTLADAIAPPVRGYPAEAFTLPSGGLPGLLGQETALFSLDSLLRPEAPYRGNHTGSPIRYRAAVRLSPATGDLTVANESLARMKKDGTPPQSPPPRIETTTSEVVVRRTGETGRPILEELGQNHTKLSDRRYAGDKYPDLEFVRAQLSNWRTYYLDPRTAMRTPQPPGEVVDIGSTGGSLAQFLYRLRNHSVHHKRFDAIVRIVRSIIPSVDGIEVDLDKQRGVVDVTVRQYGKPFSTRIVSEGTLRVMALASVAASPWPGSLVAFEEPENGVHPRRLELIANLLCTMAESGHRQVVVTTHSPKFAGLMLARSRESEWIGLSACQNASGLTQFVPFESFGALFDDAEIRQALTTPTEDGLFDAMLMRGWFDG